MKPENAKAIGILIVVVVAVFIFAYWINKTFGGIQNFLSGISSDLGLSDSPEVAAQKKAIADAKNASNNTNSPWSPLFYKGNAGAKIYTQAAGNDFAEKIWDSVGIFTSDIDDVIGVIHQMSAQSQLSYVADRFYINYGKDLLTWLTLQYTKFGTPDAGLLTITNYVSSLPKY